MLLLINASKLVLSNPLKSPDSLYFCSAFTKASKVDDTLFKASISVFNLAMVSSVLRFSHVNKLVLSANCFARSANKASSPPLVKASFKS